MPLVDDEAFPRITADDFPVENDHFVGGEDDGRRNPGTHLILIADPTRGLNTRRFVAVVDDHRNGRSETFELGVPGHRVAGRRIKVRVR